MCIRDRLLDLRFQAVIEGDDRALCLSLFTGHTAPVSYTHLSLQHEVGGYIEAIYPYEDPVALVCNEEGKLEGLPLNRAPRDEDGDIYDVVAGTLSLIHI